MKSPFPGMDPFLEAGGRWEGFHGHLIEKIYDTLCDVLPKNYLAKTGKRSYVVLAEVEGRAEHSFLPDVTVTGPRGRRTAPGQQSTPATAVAEAEPVELRAFIEHDYEERFIDIFELEPERRLVTSIEVLSPSNKKRRSPGWKQYLRKRQALLLGKANLIEIDLLRSGDRMPMLDPWPTSPYTLLVAREERAPRCRVWPAFFDRPLPPIPVPLSRPDPDLTLALQPLIDAIYERGRYREDIDYARPLTPPLTAEQSAWLEQQLRPAEPPAKPPSKPRRPRR
jgi:Protein of unknown function (DUF4058)